MSPEKRCLILLDFARGEDVRAVNYASMENFIFSKLNQGDNENFLLKRLWLRSRLGSEKPELTVQGEMLLYALIYKILCRGSRKTKSISYTLESRFGRDKEEFIHKYVESLQANAPNNAPNTARALLSWFALRLINALRHCQATAEAHQAFDPSERNDNDDYYGIYGENFYSQPDGLYHAAEIKSLLSDLQRHMLSFFELHGEKDHIRLLACMRGCHYGAEAPRSMFKRVIPKYDYQSKVLGIHPPGKNKKLMDYRNTMIGSWVYGPNSALKRDYDGNPLIRGGFERDLVFTVIGVLAKHAFEATKFCPTELPDCSERPLRAGVTT